MNTFLCVQQVEFKKHSVASISVSQCTNNCCEHVHQQKQSNNIQFLVFYMYNKCMIAGKRRSVNRNMATCYALMQETSVREQLPNPQIWVSLVVMRLTAVCRVKAEKTFIFWEKH